MAKSWHFLREASKPFLVDIDFYAIAQEILNEYFTLDFGYLIIWVLIIFLFFFIFILKLVFIKKTIARLLLAKMTSDTFFATESI